MDFLESTDIILTIIELLSIIDTRNLLRSCKKLYLLSSNKFIYLFINKKWEEKINSAFVKPESFKFILSIIERKNFTEMEKYTSEIICYGYIHLLPQRYIHENNMMFYNYGAIWLNAGFNNFLDLINFMTELVNKKCSLICFRVAEGAIMNCNLKILKLLRTKKYSLDNHNWTIAVKVQQLKILKWAKNNGYNFKPWIFDYAIDNKHLDILKFAYKNNYISENIYNAALNN